MEQKTFSIWLKCIIIATGICGLVIYALVVPSLGQVIVDKYPEFSHCYTPWLILIWISGIPCYAVLVLAWRIASNIGRDRSFSTENAVYLKWISILATGDALAFFAANIIMLCLSMNHPGIVLLSLVIVFIGIAISVVSAALSHLVNKAADLQEQSELTI